MGFRRFLAIVSVLGFFVMLLKLNSIAILTTAYLFYGFIPGMIKAVQAWSRGRSPLDDVDDDESDIEEKNNQQSA